MFYKVFDSNPTKFINENLAKICFPGVSKINRCFPFSFYFRQDFGYVNSEISDFMSKNMEKN